MNIIDYGSRGKIYKNLEIKHIKRYDYQTKGLLNKIMSPSIVKTKNKYLQAIIIFIETSFISIFKYIDRLKNFKNPLYQ